VREREPEDYPDDDSSIEDLAFDDAASGSKDKRRASHAVDFRCLSVQDIETRQTRDAEHVAGVLALKVRLLTLL
jgi:hypothetical protein